MNFRYIVLGASFAGAFALLVFVAIIGNKIFGKSGYENVVVFTQVGGLKEGDKVRFLGREIGVVDDLDVDYRTGLVKCVFYTVENLTPQAAYTYTVIQGSLFGNKVIDIKPIRTVPRDRVGRELEAKEPEAGAAREVRVVFPNRTGLRQGTYLRLESLLLGTTRSTEENAEGGETVTFELTAELPNWKQRVYVCREEPDGALFVQLLRRMPRDRSPKIAWPKTKKEFVRGYSQVDMSDMFASVEQAVQEIRTTFARLNDPEAGTIGALVSDRDMAQTVRKFVSVLGDASENESSLLYKLLRDDSMGAKFSDIMTNLEGASKSLSDALSGENPDSVAAKLLLDKEMGKKLDRIMTNLDTTLGKLQSENSSLGLLLNKREIYDELRSILRNVNASVEDIREQTPIVTFTGVLFQAFQ